MRGKEQLALKPSKPIPTLNSSSDTLNTIVDKVSKTMKYATVFQSHKRESAWPRTMLLAALAFLWLISACRATGEPSEEQIERAKKTVSEIRTSLYIPADAKLLAEKLYHGSNPELYPGCVYGHIYLAYYSPRPFEEILDEYRIGLRKADWEPSPGYAHDREDTDIFQLGSQVLMDIASFPLREDLLIVPTSTILNEQQGTIYYISLTYYDPSISNCSE
jgi:hypothetical protein